MQIPNWLSSQIPIKRWQYLVAGLVLFALKYNVDRAISYVAFDETWYFIDYFDHSKIESMTGRLGNVFPITFVITALPFIAVGTILTTRRLLDVGLPRWMVSVFFLPYINLLLFAFLSLMPSSRTNSTLEETHRRPWLDRIIPHSKSRTAFLAAICTAFFSTFAAWISITMLGDYGATLFIGIPFLQGLAATLFYGYRQQRSLGECLAITMLSVFFLGLIILVAAIEGILCLAMAVPIVIPLALLGSLVGYVIQRRTKAGLPAAMLIFALLPMMGWVEKQTHDQAPLVPVTTGVIIDRSKQEVWNQLVTFNDMREPTEFIFKAGVAYPVRAVIEGKGVGSVRRCQFSTGDFVEPITIWNEPNHLAFSVEKMPPPLIEWSLYDDLKLPHLENYFTSEKGQFKLAAINDHQTLLEGTTWYRHKIWPGLYWRLWSDHILHKIHFRVLDHIKLKAESK